METKKKFKYIICAQFHTPLQISNTERKKFTFTSVLIHRMAEVSIVQPQHKSDTMIKKILWK